MEYQSILININNAFSNFDNLIMKEKDNNEERVKQSVLFIIKRFYLYYKSVLNYYETNLKNKNDKIFKFNSYIDKEEFYNNNKVFKRSNSSYASLNNEKSNEIVKNKQIRSKSPLIPKNNKSIRSNSTSRVSNSNQFSINQSHEKKYKSYNHLSIENDSELNELFQSFSLQENKPQTPKKDYKDKIEKSLKNKILSSRNSESNYYSAEYLSIDNKDNDQLDYNSNKNKNIKISVKDRKLFNNVNNSTSSLNTSKYQDMKSSSSNSRYFNTKLSNHDNSIKNNKGIQSSQNINISLNNINPLNSIQSLSSIGNRSKQDTNKYRNLNNSGNNEISVNNQNKTVNSSNPLNNDTTTTVISNTSGIKNREALENFIKSTKNQNKESYTFTPIKSSKVKTKLNTSRNDESQINDKVLKSIFEQSKLLINKFEKQTSYRDPILNNKINLKTANNLEVNNTLKKKTGNNVAIKSKISNINTKSKCLTPSFNNNSKISSQIKIVNLIGKEKMNTSKTVPKLKNILELDKINTKSDRELSNNSYSKIYSNAKELKNSPRTKHKIESKSPKPKKTIETISSPLSKRTLEKVNYKNLLMKKYQDNKQPNDGSLSDRQKYVMEQMHTLNKEVDDFKKNSYNDRVRSASQDLYEKDVSNRKSLNKTAGTRTDYDLSRLKAKEDRLNIVKARLSESLQNRIKKKYSERVVQKMI